MADKPDLPPFEKIVENSLREFDGEPMMPDLQRRVMKRVVSLYLLHGQLEANGDNI